MALNVSVPDGPAQNGRSAATAVPGINPAPASPRRVVTRCCSECGGEFIAAAYNQMFCTRDHKRAFHKRQEARGAVLTPLAMAARITRDGTAGDKATGKKARSDSRALIAMWAAEDRTAGRMSMVDYVAARYRIGIMSKLDL